MATAVKFTSAPFGSSQPRFSIVGIRPGAFKGLNSANPRLLAKLGPGTYEHDYDTICYRVDRICEQFGSDWFKSLAIQMWKSTPHVSCKQAYELKKLQETSLGPTSYDKKDFLQILSEKKSSPFGVLDSKKKRLVDTPRDFHYTPGPGSYGNPEKRFNKFLDSWHSKYETLSSGPKEVRKTIETGSGIPPNAYHVKGSVDEVLNKVVTDRGPYDCFTGSRWGQIISGYYAQQKPYGKEPEPFVGLSFIDHLNKNKGQGKFGQNIRFSKRFGTRGSQTPTSISFRRFLDQTTGAIKEDAYFTHCKISPSPKVAFDSRVPRFTRKQMRASSKDYNMVPVGFYNVENAEQSRYVNGHTSSFKSKASKTSW